MEYTPDPKHIKEWQRIQQGYIEQNTRESLYRARCIEGLITGITLDFRTT